MALSAPWRSHRIPFFLYPLVQSQTQSIDVLWRAMVDSRAALKRPTLAVLGSVACHGIGGHRPHAVVMAPPVWLAKATAALTSALSGSRTRDWRRNWGNSSRGEAAFVQVLLLLVLNNFLTNFLPSSRSYFVHGAVGRTGTKIFVVTHIPNVWWTPLNTVTSFPKARYGDLKSIPSVH